MILLARPAPHLPRTRQALYHLGYTDHDILSFSLAEPETLPITLPPEATALLLTSPLACPALAPLPHAAALPVYAVGPTTAEAARALGLNVVFTGTDNGFTMAQDILQQSPSPHTFAHLHGDHAGMLWHSVLTGTDHRVLPVAAYRTGHIESLPQKIATTLTSQPFPAFTLLFSAGSARHLANLLKQANIACNGTALCLSEAVATEAATHWPHVRTATLPTQEGLLALLPTAPQQQENIR